MTGLTNTSVKSETLDKILQAADLAKLAPSSHNCQPWSLHLEPWSEGLKDIYHVCLTIDPARRLEGVEALELEMGLSLGAYLGVFRHALYLAGCATETTISNDQIMVKVHSIAAVDEIAASDFAMKVAARRTSRVAFDPSPIDQSQLSDLLVETWQPIKGTDMARFTISADHSRQIELAALVEKFGNLDFSNYAVWSETYSFIRFSAPRDMQEGVGFSIDNLMGPMSQLRRQSLRITLHPLVMQLLRPFGVSRKMAQMFGALVMSAPAFLVVQTDDTSFATMIVTGQRLAEIWMRAATACIGLHPLSVLVQHDAPRIELSQILDDRSRPVFVARLGHTQDRPLDTPRLKLFDFVTFSWAKPGIDAP